MYSCTETWFLHMRDSQITYWQALMLRINNWFNVCASIENTSSSTYRRISANITAFMDGMTYSACDYQVQSCRVDPRTNIVVSLRLVSAPE